MNTTLSLATQSGNTVPGRLLPSAGHPDSLLPASPPNSVLPTGLQDSLRWVLSS